MPIWAEAVRVAVVGYGYWGAKHVRVLTGIPDVEVIVVDSSGDRLFEAQRNHPMVRCSFALEDVLDEVDAVVVATPPATHVTVARVALEASRAVLVEKPLATSVEDAEELVELAAARDAMLMVGHTFEYNPAVLKLKEIVDSGELGRLLYIDTARLSLGRYQRDCNVLWDLAPHDISIVSFLLGEMPRYVEVWANRHVGRQHADVAYLQMLFDHSCVDAFVHVSWLDPCKVRRVTVVGESKMAVYNDLSDTERIRVYDSGVDPHEDDSHPFPVSYRTGDIISPYIKFTEPLLLQDQHFVDCFRTGARPRTPGERGLDVVRVLASTDVRPPRNEIGYEPLAAS
jgi:predicted dehydrogenase